MALTSRLAFVVVAAAIACAPVLAAAQSAPAVVKTPVPINEGTFAKFMKATANFSAYVKQHPGDADLGDTEFDNATDAATAICGPRPGLKAAIVAGGLTCDQWVTLTVELQKAGTAAAIVKSGQKVPPEFEVTAPDIAFYNSHKVAVTQALEEISAASDSQ